MLAVNLRIVALAGALAALGSPLVAAVVVESVRAPAGAESPLEAGDVVLRWRSLGDGPQRRGELARWGDLEVLPLVDQGGWFEPIGLMLRPPSAFFLIGGLVWASRSWSLRSARASQAAVAHAPLSATAEERA